MGRVDKRDRRVIALLLVAFDSQNSQAATAADPLKARWWTAGLDLGGPVRRSHRLRRQIRIPRPAFGVTAFPTISTLEGSITELNPELNLLALVPQNGRSLLHDVGDWES
ncbi:hypothetical protein [Brevibacterium aurantiacum]|uniref:hypothetical protein n=1 Tax=Brevibacterium aurantiacum TaxID=273384 RepID=UPI0011C0673E|nr:hypothetical protein [Brevibacterium aurantiacum]